MAKRAAIRNEGQDAEDHFIRLVAAARPSDLAKAGDAIVSVDGKDSYIEIKECHAVAGRTGTINQVRAIKYITCVVWAPGHGCWYVISPDQLVGIAATKNRGQHTEIPFESMNFGIPNIPADLHTRCSDAELSDAVHSAVRRGRSRSDIHEAMQELLSDIQGLRSRYSDRVQKVLGSNS